MVEKWIYNTVLCQTFSSCGNYMCAGNTYGDVAVYDLQKILSPSEDVSPTFRKPEYHFLINKDVQICSMATTNKFLLTGTVGEINGWDWKSVTSSSGKAPKPSWSLQLPSCKDILEKADVNSLDFKEEPGYIYAGCGDNKVHIFSIEDGRLVRSLEGHEDYIHSVQSYADNQIVSASEDGTVRLWDLRQTRATAVIQPHLSNKVARPDLGKWIGAAAVSDDWLLCGGGPRLGLWHLRSMEVTTTFKLEDYGIHVAMFYDDGVMAGGASPYFYQMNLSGDIMAQIPSSSTTVYSAVYQEEPWKVMCIAGSSSKIDLCTNFSYRDQILSFAP